MANRIVQAIYDLKDNVTAKLKKIGDGWRGSADDSDKASSAIAKNNKKLSDSFKQGAEGVSKFRAALGALVAFVGLQKLYDGLIAVLNTGEQFGDLEKRINASFGGLEQGAVALEGIKALAEGVPNSLEDVTDAAIALKKVGFDPLDGTLQALIDNNHALDGSQQDLLKTIDTLGKAQVRGTLNMRAFLQLTQQGIPVADLLSKALGKSKDEVLELARGNKLGADSIKLLVTEIGRLRAGAAADEMGDLDAQIQKLRDSLRLFLNDIAQGGALEFFQTKLAELRAKVAELTASGELQAWAKSVSSAIVSVAESLQSGAKFVYDHSAAIIGLAKAYATFKVATFLVGMAQSSAAMLKAGVDAATTAGKIGGLRGVLAKIPASVKIGVATVGIELAIAQWQKLREDIEASREIESEALKIDADTAAARNARNEQMRAIIQLYADYRTVAIKTSEEVQSATEREVQAYVEALEKSRKYFAALAIDRRKANDEAGEKEARARLDLINAALDEASKRLKVIATDRELAFAKTEGERNVLAALKELGVNAEAAGLQVTEAGAKIIKNLDLIATEATATGQQFRAAFLKAVDSAETTAELDKIRAALRTAYEGGKISAQEYAQLAAVAASRTTAIKEEADKAAGSLAKMGDGSAEAARKIIANLEAARAGVAAKAQDIANKLAESLKIPDNGAEQRRLREQYSEIDADLQQRTKTINEQKDALEGLGKQGEQAGTQIREGAKGATEAVGEVGKAAEGSAQGVGSMAAGYTALLQALNEEFAAVSENARQFFVTAQRGIVGVGIPLEKSFAKLQEIGKYVRQVIADQKEQAGTIGTLFDQLAENGEQAGTAWQAYGQQGSEALERFAEAVREGRADINLLNQADLDKLAASADAAAAKIRAIEQAARDAAAELEEMNRRTQDRIDQANGDEIAIEKRRYEEELMRIEALAKRGGELARMQYAEARRLADEEHRINLGRIQAELDARKQAQRESNGGPSGGGNPPPRPPSGGGGGGGGNNASPISPTIVMLGDLTPAQRRLLATQLGRDIKDELKRLDGLR